MDTESPHGVRAAGYRWEKLRDQCVTQDKWHATRTDYNGGTKGTEESSKLIRCH